MNYNNNNNNSLKKINNNNFVFFAKTISFCTIVNIFFNNKQITLLTLYRYNLNGSPTADNICIWTRFLSSWTIFKIVS